MREVVLDGARFDDLDGFYNEMERLLTRNLNWKPGHNLDAFNDLLRGGFGVHEYGEPLRIRWLRYERSRELLGAETTLRLIEFMLDFSDSGHCCMLELYD